MDVDWVLAEPALIPSADGVIANSVPMVAGPAHGLSRPGAVSRETSVLLLQQ